MKAFKKNFRTSKPHQEDSDDWLNEANALLSANQLTEAEQKFKSLVVAEPDFHGGFEGLAEIYRQRGRVAEARYFAQQALMRARRFIADGSMDQVVFDEIYAAYKSTDTQAYAHLPLTALVQAMAHSMEHPDSALLREILQRGAEAVPPLREVLRADEEVTWVSDFAAQLLANLKLNGVDEADEGITELIDIYRRIDEDFLDSLSIYLSVFGAKAVHLLIAVAEETELDWYQSGSAIRAAIAAAEGSDNFAELSEPIANALRLQLAGYVARKEADMEEPNVASIICDLIDLRDKAALPSMRQAFALELVDESVVDESFLTELDLPYNPQRWPFDTNWLQKHELSLLNAVHIPEDRAKPAGSPRFDDDNAGTMSRADAVREIREMLGLQRQPYVAEKKPGRNDPCWCGSGKKYKHCHLREDEAKA